MSERLKQYWATKQANMESDVVGSVLTGAVPYVSPYANRIGRIHGYITDDTNVPNDYLGFAPGVGESRIRRRQRRVRKDLVPEERWQSGRIFSDEVATMTPILMLSAIGGGIGADSGAQDGARKGALIGSGVGIATGAVAALMAAITKRRTRAEQTESEKSPGILNHLIPGRAIYNKYKRLGYSANYDK